MSQDARRDEELSTQRRARILGLEYHDTSTGDKPLYKDILSVEELYQLKVAPIIADESQLMFGITNTTSQQTIDRLRNRFLDQRVSFKLISDAGYRDYMRLYDPPKRVVYQDIAINAADQEQIISKVSSTLDQVRADDMLAYLVQQAHSLGASDIHVENQKEAVRIRFRIDGVLHPIARIG